MTPTRALAVDLLWVPVVPVLFRLLGPPRAVLVAVFGGYLFLPHMAAVFDYLVPGLHLLQLDKRTATGIGLVLGVVAFDRPALRRFRPHWVDLPMLAFVAAPVASLWANRFDRWDFGLDQSWYRLTAWAVPYLAARLYFGHGEGVRRVAAAVVYAGTAYIPFCWFEALAGPRWYLAGLLYGKVARSTEVYRMGGYRPEVFLLFGLELAAWMALSTVVAFWLWVGRGGWTPPRRVPRWLPFVALLVTTIACRGAYGYVLLAAGLVTAGLMQLTRSRWPLVLLLLVPVSYIAPRAAGRWDGMDLVRAAERFGKAGTVVYRLKAENQYITKVWEHNPAFGFGGSDWGIFDYWAQSFLWPDGWWIHFLVQGGLVGLALFYLALFYTPAGLAASRLPSRTIRGSSVSPAWGLVLFLALHSVDALHNYDLIAPTGLIGGALVGLYLTARRPARDAGAGEGASARPAAERAPSAGLVAAGACLLYVFGHAPVAGYPRVQLVGGFGAALLFAAAGAAGAAAAGRVPLARLAAFAAAFAALGVSFNLALHPSTRPVFSADILQALPLAGLAVAGWRVLVGRRLWAGAALAAGALLAHFLVGPWVPALPGSQYVFAGPDPSWSLFPVLPWLAVAAVGARAASAGWGDGLAASALFAAAGAATAWADPAGAVKIPMNLPYALLSCAAAEAAFLLAAALRRWPPLVRGGAWLGRNWLVFFYAHLAVAALIAPARLASPWAVWALLAAGSVGATWLARAALDPLAGWFRRPVAWAVPALAVVVAAVGSLPPTALSLVAGLTGLVFAAHYEALPVALSRAQAAGEAPPRPAPRARAGQAWGAGDVPEGPAEPVSMGAGLARLAVVLGLLALPEMVAGFESFVGPSRTAPAPALNGTGRLTPPPDVPARAGPGR